MLGYDVHSDLENYFQPIFDAVHEQMTAYRSVSPIQVQTYGETLL